MIVRCMYTRWRNSDQGYIRDGDSLQQRKIDIDVTKIRRYPKEIYTPSALSSLPRRTWWYLREVSDWSAIEETLLMREGDVLFEVAFPNEAMELVGTQEHS